MGNRVRVGTGDRIWTSRLVLVAASLLLVSGCGADGEGSPYPNCQADSSGCSCRADGPDTVDECSEASLGGDAVCCEFDSDSCACTALACGQTASGFCACGSANVVLDTESTEVTSCVGGVGRHCCLGSGSIIGALCTCSSLECQPSDTEVLDCTTEATASCGSNDVQLSSCT